MMVSTVWRAAREPRAARRRSGPRPRFRELGLTLALASAIKLGFELSILRHVHDRHHSVLKRSALLMVRDLRRVTLARFICGALGGVVLPALGVLLIAPRAAGRRRSAAGRAHRRDLRPVPRGRAVRALPVLLGGAVVEDAGSAGLMRREPPGSAAHRRVADPARSGRGRSRATLMLTPGRFGLGRVPARLEPDQTTTMVCGFCSTGCGLEIHLRDGAAVNLSPSSRLSGQHRHGLPQGVGGLTPLRALDRAVEPLLRERGEAARAPPQPVTWPVALDTMVEPLQGDPGQARPGVGRVPLDRPDRHRGDGAAGRAREVRHGDGARRRQHPPVHGDGGAAYKQSFGFDAPPFTYRDFEESDVIVLVGVEPVHRAPDHVGADPAQPATIRRSWSSTRARPRPRWPRARTTPCGRSRT